MNALYGLDDVVVGLEDSVNLDRIKKLLYFVVYGKWEGNNKKLGEIEVKKMLGDLLELNYSLEELDSLLKDICSKINKQVEYLEVADQIIHVLAPLYPEVSSENSMPISWMKDSTQELLDLERQSIIQSSLSGDPVPPLTKAIGLEGDAEDGVRNDLFDVRLKLVQRTNPLRVKILIFSALNQPFTFSDRDWLALKKYRLDELLKKLLINCPHKKTLENRLYKTAKKFENKNENIQVASAIVKYLSPLYEKISHKLIHEAVNQGTAFIANENSEDDSVDKRVEKSVEDERAERDDLANYEAIADRQNGYSDQAPINLSQRESQHFLDDYQYPGQIYAEENEHTIPELHTGLSEDVRKLTNFLENDRDRAVNRAENMHPVGQVRKGLKIMDSLKRNLGLEEELKTLVNSHVNRLMQEVETALSDLENLLDDRLKGQQAAKASSLKYKSMKEMIYLVQENTSKYLDLLHEMQEADIQQPDPSTQPWSNPPATEQNHGQLSADRRQPKVDKSADATQAKVIKLAKEGNPKAIAALMNQLLKSRGIHTLATIKNYCLHIVLESEQELNQKASIKVVRKNVMPLELSCITKVKVHWRKTGSQSPAWSHDFSYHVDD